MKAKGKINFLLSTLILLGMQQYAHAALIAIVDSGSDLTHPDLAAKAWVNPSDDSSLGYSGDIHGWNFVNNSSTLVDLSLVNKFSQDVYTFFDVQMRLSDGTETKTLNASKFNADAAWIKAKCNDKAFMAELDVFGDFAHGTNVAGIAAKDSPNATLMGITLIAGPPPASSQNSTQAPVPFLPGVPNFAKIYAILDDMIGNSAPDPNDTSSKVGSYLDSKDVKVANCSFGTPAEVSIGMVNEAIKMSGMLFITEEQTLQFVDYVMTQIMKNEAAELIDVAPKTLFVIAAGNDSYDNDQVFTSPANIKRDNTIAVAATVGRLRLAKFSNYGATTVDVAAPGVGILSDSPGGKHVRMSGTSQATPFVTNIAGRILDTNSALSPLQVKQILIGTVDKKDFLKGKVSSGGIVNPDRAILAAKLSLQANSLADAIAKSLTAVSDLADTDEFPEAIEQAIVVKPLMSKYRRK